jgi:hypothetical protein
MVSSCSIDVPGTLHSHENKARFAGSDIVPVIFSSFAEAV